MSEARRMRRQRLVAERKRLAKAAVVAAQATGCCCVVGVSVADHGDGLYRATLSHDDWCPLLRVVTESADPSVVPNGPIVLVPKAWEPT